MLNKISFFIDSLIKMVGKVSAIFVVALILIIVYDALNRYLFSSGSILLQEIEWHLFDLIFLFGISYALKHDKHVRVDILYAKYSNKTKNILNIFSNLFIIIPFSIVIVYYCSDSVFSSIIRRQYWNIVQTSLRSFLFTFYIYGLGVTHKE